MPQFDLDVKSAPIHNLKNLATEGCSTLASAMQSGMVVVLTIRLYKKVQSAAEVINVAYRARHPMVMRRRE